MKNGFLDDLAVAEMLDYDPLQQWWRDPAIPDAFGVHHNDRAAGTDSEARRLPAFDSCRTEEQPFTLQQRRKEVIQLSATPVGRAEAAHAHENVA